MTHGDFQDKKVMQTAFRWVGEHTPRGITIITQPKYAGQNDDWLRAGWTTWASRYYSSREMASLRYPDKWGNGPEKWVVVNRFWLQGENMRFDDTDQISARFDSLRQVWNLHKVKEFVGTPEPMWLKKLNMLSFYPIDFMVYRPRFEIWSNVN